MCLNSERIRKAPAEAGLVRWAPHRLRRACRAALIRPPVPPTGPGRTRSRSPWPRIGGNYDAQFTVSADGAELAPVFVAKASHGSGQAGILTLNGTWPGDQHTIVVNGTDEGPAWGNLRLYTSVLAAPEHAPANAGRDADLHGFRPLVSRFVIFGGRGGSGSSSARFTISRQSLAGLCCETFGQHFGGFGELCKRCVVAIPISPKKLDYTVNTAVVRVIVFWIGLLRYRLPRRSQRLGGAIAYGQSDRVELGMVAPPVRFFSGVR